MITMKSAGVSFGENWALLTLPRPLTLLHYGTLKDLHSAVCLVNTFSDNHVTDNGIPRKF